MIYEWIAKKSNQTARKLIGVLFFGAIALMLVTTAIGHLPYRWVFQLLAVLMWIGVILLISRYESKLYIYRLERTADESVDLTVTEANPRGKRQITVCRVSTAGIRSRMLLDMTDPAGMKQSLSDLKKQKLKRFDYCADLRPEKSCLIVVEEGGEELAIRLSYDEALFSFLAPTESEE